jgi:uncharacterized membrane protein YgcG
MFFIVIGIFSTGCMQLSNTGPVTPVITATIVPMVGATIAPQQVVTIIHQVSQVKDVKDSELLFSLQVPVEWNVSTHRLENPENFVGFMYQTDLVGNNKFFIQSYINYEERDQNYRDDCRRWSPAPIVTNVTINGIIFDRFESTANGTTNVTYVARKTSTNERGYLSVLAFSANTSSRFEKEDYDKVVSSFRYYPKEDISTMPGEEIPRISLYEHEGGNAHSVVVSSSSGFSGSRSSAGSSSGRSSSGGCGCGG